MNVKTSKLSELLVMICQILTIVLLCSLSQVTAATPIASIPKVSTQTATQLASSTATNSDDTSLNQSKQQINQIVYGGQFSKAIPQTKWQENSPKSKEKGFWERLMDRLNQKQQDPNTPNHAKLDTAVIYGNIIKFILLIALFGFIVWLLLQRQKWLPWFRNQAARYRRQGKATIDSFDQPLAKPLWQGLPQKSSMVIAVEQALQAQDWLLALSLLYRGTLREVMQIHDLPITRASTEQQCTWLLEQAKHKQPNEANFFKNLVQLWSQVAYGKLAVAQSDAADFSQKIQQLLVVWQQLYSQSHTANLAVRQQAGMA